MSCEVYNQSQVISIHGKHLVVFLTDDPEESTADKYPCDKCGDHSRFTKVTIWKPLEVTEAYVEETLENVELTKEMVGKIMKKLMVNVTCDVCCIV